MPIQFVLLPLFVQVALTLGLMCWTAMLRTRDLKTRAVAIRDIALGQPNWPARTMQVGNCFNNQMQLPILFYLLTILVLITRHADIFFVVLAWIFVLSRVAHAYIHTTSNDVRQRGPIYGIGLLVLIIMWVIFMVRMLLGLP